MKPTVLQLCALSPALDAALAEEYQVLRGWEQPDTDALLAEHGSAIVGIATAAPTGVPRALIEALPALKVISCRGVGLDKIDLALAKDRGVQVAGTFGTLADCVADLAFALLLDVAREVAASDRYLRDGQWAKGRYPLTTRVSGKRLGIVGLGQIGRLVAKRGSGFDMEVAYNNRRPVADVDYRHEPSLKALAEWADFLVVCVAGGSGTEALISRDVIEALGPKGYLVNVSRGTVVDEPALIEALQQKRIAGAGLDVFVDEPQVPAALIEMHNVVLTPHTGSGTVETRQAMEDLVLENLRAYFRDGQVKTPA